MTLSDLHNGQQVRYRLGLHTRGIAPDWSEWQTGELYIYRRLADLPPSVRKRTRLWHAGDLLTVSIRSEAPEFSGEDFDPTYRVFNCEENLLEIEGLV
jgi:hypothetical protein